MSCDVETTSLTLNLAFWVHRYSISTRSCYIALYFMASFARYTCRRPCVLSRVWSPFREHKRLVQLCSGPVLDVCVWSHSFVILSGANIFLVANDKLKLGDFGCSAKLKEHTTIPGEMVAFVGTAGKSLGYDCWAVIFCRTHHLRNIGLNLFLVLVLSLNELDMSKQGVRTPPWSNSLV